MEKEQISDVIQWFERIQTYAMRAIDLLEQLPCDIDESDHLFWALVKYAENVEESLVKIDEINKNIFRELTEFKESDWKDLKGMRSRLAHAFWKIDPEILRDTIAIDFAKLTRLVSTLWVGKELLTKTGEFRIRFNKEEFAMLPDFTSDMENEAGSYKIALYFLDDGEVLVFRIGFNASKHLLTITNNKKLDFKVFAR